MSRSIARVCVLVAAAAVGWLITIYGLAALLRWSGARPGPGAQSSLEYSTPSARDPGGGFLGYTRFTADELNRTRQGSDLRAIHFVPATVPSTGPSVVSVNPIDDFTWTAASQSDETDRCYLIALVDLSPYEGALVGSNPDGLALARNGQTLYVANSGNNDVAVVDVKTGRVDGMIPTAWYPTDVALSPNAQRMYVTSAKGLGAGPNTGTGFPNPESKTPTSPSQYVGSMMVGSLSTLDTPNPAKLGGLSKQVVANNGFDERDKVRTGGAPPTVVPVHPGDASPIKHVIYIVKENRTYDQEFGSLGKGNGDASLNLFGDESAPNARALQRQFVTFDNFYADAEISAQGWNWSTGANSNPYVEQTFPANYSPRNHPYDYEGGNNATAPNTDTADSFLWDRLADANVTFRNYGFFKAGPAFNTGSTAADPRLAANDDGSFWGYDLGCPDSSATFTALSPCPLPRVDEWSREFAGFVTSGKLPAVELLRLPNDHTAGTRVGSPTPKAYVADNDYALGRVVDAVSHSPYWSSTAIFVVEDDAQNGPDHVDAHRTIAQVISPYTRTGKVDSTFYSTVSMLRTMELLVGLKPMTQFDAAATPMLNAFTPTADTSPYTVTKPADSVLKAVNSPTAALAAASAKQDLVHEDRIDETTFNQAIWQSVKGAGSTMPTPRHNVIGPSAAAAVD